MPPVAETEASFATPPAGALWRAEPFRLFFPLGVLLGWVGVGHWLLYALGLAATYSCQFHGLVQVESFLMAFATGFLMTALPRRTQTAAPSAVEMVVAAAALVATTGAAAFERWALAEAAYATLFLLLLGFAVRRFVGRAARRRPPAAFVMIPIGALAGLAGAALVAASTWPRVPAWTMGLGRLFVEQGVFLCWTLGVGSLVLPLMAGTPPPPDLGSTPRETVKALAYAAAGAAILATLVAEKAGSAHAAPLVRALVVAVGLAAGGGAWRAPGKPGLHRRLAWLAVWCIPLGLAAAGLFPSYRVPALHVLFVGGFGLLVFAVATHVALGHLGLKHLGFGSPLAVRVLGTAVLLAMVARVAADWSTTYFAHLGSASALWLAGTAVWLAFIGPKLLGR
jgi:uncharacterized protein involved in response to NO